MLVVLLLYAASRMRAIAFRAHTIPYIIHQPGSASEISDARWTVTIGPPPWLPIPVGHTQRWRHWNRVHSSQRCV